MTDELDAALRRALRRRAPGADLSGRVLSRLPSADLPPAAARAGSSRGRALRSLRMWLPAALAACIIAGIGLVQMREHAVAVARANQARAQLLQALSIASLNINVVRAAVSREENPDS
jgi:hypothetical protein